MLDLSTQKKTTATKNRAKPGTYTSEVKSVAWAKGYVKESAFKVKYVLTDEAGGKSEYDELFHRDNDNARTNAFYDYLVEQGITELKDFKGCKEKLVLAKDGHNRGLICIEEREFLGRGEASTDVGTKD